MSGLFLTKTLPDEFTLVDIMKHHLEDDRKWSWCRCWYPWYVISPTLLSCFPDKDVNYSFPKLSVRSRWQTHQFFQAWTESRWSMVPERDNEWVQRGLEEIWTQNSWRWQHLQIHIFHKFLKESISIFLGGKDTWWFTQIRKRFPMYWEPPTCLLPTFTTSVAEFSAILLDEIIPVKVLEERHK